MNSIKSLIAETKKGCGKPVLDITGEISIFCGDSLDEKTDKDGRTLFLIGRCQTCQTKLETLKLCQTIFEKDRLENCQVINLLNSKITKLEIERKQCQTIADEKKIWCCLCNGEDEASICMWCYQNLKDKNQARDKK
jgi:hypothetical protein